jgi:hypothetical protein
MLLIKTFKFYKLHNNFDSFCKMAVFTPFILSHVSEKLMKVLVRNFFCKAATLISRCHML